MSWRDLAIYGVFLLIPFITFPFILLTAERSTREMEGGEENEEGEE